MMINSFNSNISRQNQQNKNTPGFGLSPALMVRAADKAANKGRNELAGKLVNKLAENTTFKKHGIGKGVLQRWLKKSGITKGLEDFVATRQTQIHLKG